MAHPLAAVFAALTLLVPPAGWLGIMLDSDRDQPVVAEVIPGSPAEDAGLQPGDVVLAIDDDTTPNVEDLVSALGIRHAGDRVVVRIRRGRETRAVLVTLARRPQEEGDAAGVGGAAGARGAAAEPAPASETAPAPVPELRLRVFGRGKGADAVLAAPAVAAALRGFAIERMGGGDAPLRLEVCSPDGELLGSLEDPSSASAVRTFLRRAREQWQRQRALAALRDEVAALRRELDELVDLLQARR